MTGDTKIPVSLQKTAPKKDCEQRGLSKVGRVCAPRVYLGDMHACPYLTEQAVHLASMHVRKDMARGYASIAPT